MQNFKASFDELKNTRTITTMAVLLALSIILGFFTVAIGNYLKIGFSTIPNQIASLLFGPVAGVVFGASADLFKYIVKPTGAFFPGFTFNEALAGAIYGVFLYRKPVSLLRVFAAKLTVMIIINMLLTTYWLSVLYGDAFLALLPARVLKQIIMLPIDTLILYFTAKTVTAFKKIIPQ